MESDAVAAADIVDDTAASRERRLLEDDDCETEKGNMTHCAAPRPAVELTSVQ